jgi:hypothetical protein
MAAEFQSTAEDNGAGEQAVADAQAAARAEQGILPESTPEPSEVPAWCPEKYARFNEDGSFNSDLAATEMSKGMDHLNKMATQNSQGQDDLTEDDLEEQDNAPADDDLPEPEHEPLTSPEFWEEMRQEYVNTNELSAESRQIIRDMGIPDQMVSDYIDGQQARAEGFTNTVTSILPGGQAEYEALIDWADSNMDPAEAEVFNDAILSGEVTKAQIALRGLKHQYSAVEGSTADMLGGAPSGSSGDSVSGFTSRAEMSAAINDPRYSRDATYRQGVEQRVLRTNL